MPPDRYFRPQSESGFLNLASRIPPEQLSQLQAIFSTIALNDGMKKFYQIGTRILKDLGFSETETKTAALVLSAQGDLNTNKISPVYSDLNPEAADLVSPFFKEGSIVICNHPTAGKRPPLDSQIVLNRLAQEKRGLKENFCIFVDEEHFESSGEFYGKEHFELAGKAELDERLEAVAQRINTGQTFIMFPSFKSEFPANLNAKKPELYFTRPFVWLVERMQQLNPNTPVYSLAINPYDIDTANRSFSMPNIVSVTGSYGIIDDWSEMIPQTGLNESAKMVEAGKTMATKYIEIHNLKKYYTNGGNS